MIPLLAQVGGYSIAQWAIIILIAAGVITIAVIGLRAMGWKVPPIPAWAWQIVGVIIVVVVCVFGIKFLLSVV